MASTAEVALAPPRRRASARLTTGALRRGRRRRSNRGPQQYDLFISHSRRLDARLAEAVQRGVETFAKPWWQPRSLRVFRDVSSLSANPHLWGSIEAALGRTRYLLLLASPEAAASPWVRKELEWWITHRDTDTLLLAVTAGRVPWSEPEGEDGDPSCIPTDLEALYADPPRWVDLRALRSEEQISRHNPVLVDAVADLGAAVRGVDKDELVGEHIRQNRRVRRTAWSAVTLLSLLTVATVVAAFLFAVQRNTARDQARIATARQFAATAEAELGDRIDQSMLLAAKAYQLHPEPRTYAAAFRAATASPALVAIAYARSPISAVSVTADGDLVVVGEDDGTVASWDVRSGEWRSYGRLPHPVLSVSAAPDGAAVAATDGSRVVLLKRGRHPAVLVQDPHDELTAVAVSADSVFWARVSYDPAQTLVTGRRLAGGSLATATLPDHGLDRLAVDAGTLIGFDSTGGYWVRLSLPGLAPLAETATGFGNHDYASAMSDDGASFAWTNSAGTIPVWDTPGTTGGVPSGSVDPAATRWGRSRGVSPDAMALSARGARLAVSDAGTVYVSEPVADENAAAVGWRLEGMAGVGVRNLQFLDDDRLVSTGQRQLTVWDLAQVSPLATWQSAEVPFACRACTGAHVVVSPDGKRVASVGDAFANSLVIHDLAADRDVWFSPPGDSPVGPPAWAPDGRHLLVPRGQLGTVDVVDASTATRVASWPSDGSAEDVIATRVTAGGARYLSAVASGRVTIRDARSGRVLRKTHALPPAYRIDLGSDRRAAIDATGTRLTLSGQRGKQTPQYGAETVDLGSGAVTRLLGPSDFVYAISYAGSRLLISGVSDRTRESWIDLYGVDAATRLRRIDTGFGMLEAAVASENGPLIAYQALDGGVVLLEAATGDVVGSFPLLASTEAFKTGLAFDRSGEDLVTVSEGNDTSPGYIETWSVAPADVTRTLCELAGRTLTTPEWRSLAGRSTPDLTCR